MTFGLVYVSVGGQVVDKKHNDVLTPAIRKV